MSIEDSDDVPKSSEEKVVKASMDNVYDSVRQRNSSVEDRLKGS